MIGCLVFVSPKEFKSNIGVLKELFNIFIKPDKLRYEHACLKNVLKMNFEFF